VPGAVVYQDLSRVDVAIEDGSFYSNPALSQAVCAGQQNDSTLHIMACSPRRRAQPREPHFCHAGNGGARRSEESLSARVSDGRDTPPKSASQSLQLLQEKCNTLGTGQIASIVGRFYVMDRDNRWERVQPAYELLTQARPNLPHPMH